MAGYDNHTVQSNGVQSSEDEDYPVPPPMPKKLPKLVELLISKTPEIYQPAVACAIFPPLATHLWRTRFRYIDNVEQEATLASVLYRFPQNFICVERYLLYKKVREHSFAHGLFKLSDSYKCLTP